MKKYKGTIQENGQTVLPSEWLEKLGVQPGDSLLFIEGEDGSLVVFPRRAIGIKAMNEIGEALRATGITLEEFLEEGEKIRQEIYEEKSVHKVAGDA